MTARPIHRPPPAARSLAAVLAAAALALPGAGRAEPEVFLVDGMVVDALHPPEKERAPFQVRLPSLAGGTVRPRRPAFSMEDPERSPTEMQRARAHLERAEEQARAGQFARALMELRDGLAYDPGNPMLLSRAAIHAAALRDYDRAAGYFRRFLERQPDDAAHKVGYAAVLLRLARFDEAERLVSEARPVLPDNLALRFTQTAVDFVRERPVRADAYWTRRTLDQVAVVVSWLENDRETLMDLMGSDDYARLGDHTLGAGTAAHLSAIARHLETVLNTAADADPASAFAALDALANLGVHTLGIDAHRAELAMVAGRGPEALARWRAVIEQAPDWAHARLQYGFALLRMDRMSDAVDALRRAREQADEPIVRFLLASALALDGRRDEARDLFNRLAQRHPDALRQWLAIDPRFDRAIRRMDNYANIMRLIGVPPEMD